MNGSSTFTHLKTVSVFEPDFVLFLQKNSGSKFEQLQIFIEPKGTHLLLKDEWKENFLLHLREHAIPIKKFVDDTKYSIWGLHFFNQEDNLRKFDNDFMALI